MVPILSPRFFWTSCFSERASRDAVWDRLLRMLLISENREEEATRFPSLFLLQLTLPLFADSWGQAEHCACGQFWGNFMPLGPFLPRGL